MKKQIRLTESDLRNIIGKSVMKILNEGSTSDTGVPTAWDNLKEMIGADAMIDAIWNYADSDTLQKYVDWMIDDFELDHGEVYGEEEDFDDESDEEYLDDTSF